MENKFTLSPKEYNTILDGVQLKKLILAESNTKLYNYETSNDDKIVINVEDKSTFKNTDAYTVEVQHHYDMTSCFDKSKHKVVTISVKYILIYSCKVKFTNNFFDIFKKVSLPMQTWPFFREYINSATSHMNIPPFTLPLVKR